ncbi:PspC domain-containing protein [Streptomyces antnestii]|uniref:PspC domain-containing protein n=1 Tax=Streptomyces antnestii TaxID=2494256 RepID=A0A3S2YS62_9ACTN|nr:PspC domain-containing protein [Streptomyces sp. San01]RVU17875.1 PspC domain-containing protein [Streptomyces sp. San01]
MTDHQHATTGAEAGQPQDGAPGHGSAGASAPSAPGQETGTAAAPARFRRDRRNGTLGGVCAGLGRHCDMDPVIFRIGLAVIAATGGLGLIFYGFAWLFVPYDEEEENEARKLLSGRVDGPALTAVLFALVGCGLFLSMLNNGGVLTFAAVLTLLLAGAGYWSQQRGAAGPDPLAAQAVADAPPEAQAPPVTGAPSWWRDPIVKDGTHVGGTGYFWGPDSAVDVRYEPTGHRHGTAWLPDDAPGGSGPGPHSDSGSDAAPRQRGPRWIGGWTFLFALAAGGASTVATWHGHPLGTALQTGLASALVVFGLGIALSAFLGRTGAGSVILAVLTAGLLVSSAVLPANITTRWVHTDWTPASATQVAPRYELGTGVGTLDLSGVDVGKGKTVTTRVEVGAGQLKAVLPKNATVVLRAEVGIGDIRMPDERTKDVDIRPGQDQKTTLPPPAGSKDGGTVVLRLEVGVGQVEVARAAS